MKVLSTLLKVVFAVVCFQGVLMSAQLYKIESQDTQTVLLFEQSDYIPIVQVQLVFTQAGALAQAKEGLADMSARLLNEGTKKEGSLAFAKSLEDRAVSLHAYAGRETFVIELSALKEEFEFALSRMLDLLQDPNYTQEAFEHVRRQKTGWLERKQSDFDFIAGRGLRKLLFGDSALGKPYEGTMQSIQSIKLEDIASFIKSKLGKNNLIVVAGGDLNLTQAQDLTKRVVKILPATDVDPIAPIRVSDKERYERIYEPTRQAYIYFGAPFDFAYDSKERYKARVAEFILGGGGFGSRMMEEIRVKRGLAYSAYASLRRTKSASYLSGYLQTKLASEHEAIEIVKRVVKDFVTKGVTQEELDEAKAFLVGSEPLRLESLSQRLNRAFNEYYYGWGLGESKKDLQRIEALSLQELNAFIKKHPEIAKLSFSIVTRPKESERP